MQVQRAGAETQVRLFILPVEDSFPCFSKKMSGGAPGGRQARNHKAQLGGGCIAGEGCDQNRRLQVGVDWWHSHGDQTYYQ